MPSGKQVWLEMIVMTLLGVFVPVVVYLDLVVFFGEVGERSLTEAGQQVFLAVSGGIFAAGAFRLSDAKGYLAAMATLSVLMFIRESDSVLDQITHGFWVYPALVCILIGGTVVWKNRKTLGSGFVVHFATRQGTLVFLGLFLTIIFSRMFGSGQLWRPAMAENYAPVMKGAIQEGLELLGYAIFTFGTVMSARTKFK
ncbi:MAG: hypothetical protein ABJL67_03070 [Sulfitobacter sp.]